MERAGTKEGCTAVAAGRCITLRWHRSVCRRDGGGVGLLGRERHVNISKAGRGHLQAHCHAAN